MKNLIPMTDQNIIILLVLAIVISKIIIGFLIYFLVKRNKELKSERKLLSEHNQILKNHVEIIENQKDELKDAEKFKLKILSIASHDLRTPFNDLNMMFDNFSLLESRPDIIKESMKEVKGQICVVQETLDNILSWTIAHLKKLENHAQEEINITKHINSIVDLYDLRIRQKRIKVKFCMLKDYFTMGNAETFNFAMRNLLNNAIKFSPTDSVIEIKISKNGNTGRVSLYDQGIGMDSNKIDRINSGEYHHSEVGTNQEKGSGIGLALCKELLKKQGWILRVDSLLGKGTEMQLILPLQKSAYSDN